MSEPTKPEYSIGLGEESPVCNDFLFVLCVCSWTPITDRSQDWTPVCLRPNLEVGREVSDLLPFLLLRDLRCRGLKLRGTLLSFFRRALETQGTKTTVILSVIVFSSVTHCAHVNESTLERAWEIQEWVLKISLSDCVRQSRSSCQASKCEEDDSYARKPRRQRKRTVRSGFPSRHWLILPLRVACIWERESVSTVSVLEASLTNRSVQRMR